MAEETADTAPVAKGKSKAKSAESDGPAEGFVRLNNIGPEGGFIDVTPDHAQATLEVEKRMGVKNYELEE